jgi:hypothetical protein
MKRILVIAGCLLALGAAAFYFYRVAPQQRARAALDEHRQALDRELEPLTAMLKAPEGNTPCETSYNGFTAFGESAKQTGQPLPWVSFPDRATFLQRCGALPEQEQLCLQPRYPGRHAGVCDQILERLNSSGVLFESRPGQKRPLSEPPAGAR